MHDEPHRHFRLHFIHEINGLCYIQFSLLKYAKKNICCNICFCLDTTLEKCIEKSPGSGAYKRSVQKK